MGTTEEAETEPSLLTVAEETVRELVIELTLLIVGDSGWGASTCPPCERHKAASLSVKGLLLSIEVKTNNGGRYLHIPKLSSSEVVRLDISSLRIVYSKGSMSWVRDIMRSEWS